MKLRDEIAEIADHMRVIVHEFDIWVHVGPAVVTA